MAEKQVVLCKAMGNARRLVILWMISQQELSVSEITERVGTSMQNISQHLNFLKRAGMVTTRRDGQTIFYQIADSELINECPILQRAPETINYTIG